MLPDLPPELLGSEKIHGGGGIRGINSFINEPLGQQSPCRSSCALCSACLSPPDVHQTKRTWLSWRIGLRANVTSRPRDAGSSFQSPSWVFCSGEDRSGNPHGRRAGFLFLGPFSGIPCLALWPGSPYYYCMRASWDQRSHCSLKRHRSFCSACLPLAGRGSPINTCRINWQFCTSCTLMTTCCGMEEWVKVD